MKIFTVSGISLATIPWMIQLRMATALILLYNAGGPNLLRVVESGLEDKKSRGGSDGSTRGRVLIWTCNDIDR
ncbi:uncharacterized protein J3R85_009259 [Psidium guajava]|nr:uncharacterized protein J3R85_009259 [Psidium guajava]